MAGPGAAGIFYHGPEPHQEPIYSPDPGSAHELCKNVPVAGLEGRSQIIFLEMEFEPLKEGILLAARVGAGAIVVLSPLIPVHHSNSSVPS